jgi:hypothetical protein
MWTVIIIKKTGKELIDKDTDDKIFDILNIMLCR